MKIKFKKLFRRSRIPREVAPSFKFFSAVLILVFAAIDYYLAQKLFTELDYADFALITNSLSIAIFMELLPVYIAKSMCELIDKTGYSKTDKGPAVVTFICSLLAFLFAAGLLFYLRWSQLGSPEDWETKKIMAEALGEADPISAAIWGMVIPMVTSIGAFAVSMAAFRDTGYNKVCRISAELEDMSVTVRAEASRAYTRFKEGSESLWASLADPDLEPVPTRYEDFRKQCVTRIRKKLIQNCMNAYPSQMERYNAEVESALANMILRIADCSTLPYTISCIGIEDLLTTYDGYVADPADKWDFNQAGAELYREFEKTLENSVTTAQFRSTFAWDEQ